MDNIEKNVELLKLFFPNIRKIREIPIGNVNQTFLVKITTGTIIAQRINKKVFNNIKALCHNLQQFLDEVRKKHDLAAITPEFITFKNKVINPDSEGNYWKFTKHIPNSICNQYPACSEHAYLAATTLAIFHRNAVNFKVRKFRTVIRDFFNPKKKLSFFKKALKQGVKERIKQSQDLVKAIDNFYKNIEIYFSKMAEIKKYVLHQDTKFENFLITPKKAYLIDHDTLQPGSIVLDLGDFLRTVAFSSKEDQVEILEPNPDFVKAALEGLKILNYFRVFRLEPELFSLAPCLVSFILSIRFLADFLLGDVYFKISYENQNLLRAKSQFLKALCLYKIRKSFSKVF